MYRPGAGVLECQFGQSESALYDPGYRVYFVQRTDVVVILLSGGDKSSQQADIAKQLEV